MTEHNEPTSRDGRDYRGDEPRKPNNWERASVVFSGLLFVVGAAYSWFAYQQWQATKTALEISERAWVTSAQARFASFSNIGERPEAVIIFQNSGKSPALQTTINANIGFGFGNLTQTAMPLLPPNNMMSIAAAGPGTPMSSPIKMKDPLTEAQVAALKEGVGFVYAFGTVTYKDIFDREHHTQYCWRLGPTNTEPSKSAVLLCNRWNTAD